MEWVETTAKTVEEAKELALDQLGVDIAEAEFEVVDEPKSGLFGRTRGTARVRARVIPITPPSKVERQRRSRKRGEGTDADQRSKQDRDERNRGDRSGPAGGAPKSTGSAGPKTAVQQRSSDEKREASSVTATKPRKSSTKGQDERSKREAREMMDEGEQRSVLEQFLVELAASFGLTAAATSTMVDNELTVNLEGDGLGLLVGPRLMTLDALQEIARNALQRQAAGREYAKVVVDVAGIRSRRRDALSSFVTDAARQVTEEGVEVVFEVMSSSDRKQVHDVASGLDGIASGSEGEDPRRRVVLRPTRVG